MTCSTVDCAEGAVVEPTSDRAEVDDGDGVIDGDVPLLGTDPWGKEDEGFAEGVYGRLETGLDDGSTLCEVERFSAGLLEQVDEYGMQLKFIETTPIVALEGAPETELIKISWLVELPQFVF